MAFDPLTMLGNVVDKGLGIIDKFVPDKDLATRIKAGVKSQILEQGHSEFITLLNTQKDIIVAEAKSQSWIARNWRPITMLVFVTIIANNYILYPYLALFWVKAPLMEIPIHLWSLLKIGIGGYVIGRSGESIAKALKK